MFTIKICFAPARQTLRTCIANPEVSEVSLELKLVAHSGSEPLLRILFSPVWLFYIHDFLYSTAGLTIYHPVDKPVILV